MDNWEAIYSCPVCYEDAIPMLVLWKEFQYCRKCKVELDETKSPVRMRSIPKCRGGHKQIDCNDMTCGICHV